MVNNHSSVVRVRGPADIALEMIRSRYPHYHPLIALANLAHRDDVVADPKLELEVHKAILPYVAPKLSSIEVKSNNVEDRRVVVSLFETHTLENGSIVDVEVPLVRDISEVVRLD